MYSFGAIRMFKNQSKDLLLWLLNWYSWCYGDGALYPGKYSFYSSVLPMVFINTPAEEISPVYDIALLQQRMRSHLLKLQCHSLRHRQMVDICLL